METQEQAIQYISIDLIDDPKVAMRSEIELTTLQELADDIRRNGLIEPIIVRPVGGRFEVVAGHRRTTACKLTGMTKIACIVRELDEQQAIAVKVSENFHRADVDPVDEALFYAELNTHHSISLEEIARLIGRREEYVQSRLDLLLYPPEIVSAIQAKTIKLGVAKWLAKIENETDRKTYLEYAIKDGVTEYAAMNWYNHWYYQSQTNPEQTVAEYTPQEIRDIARPKIVCQRCNIGSDIRELIQVYIHRAGCDSYIEAYRNSNPEPSNDGEETVQEQATPLPLPAS